MDLDTYRDTQQNRVVNFPCWARVQVVVDPCPWRCPLSVLTGVVRRAEIHGPRSLNWLELFRCVNLNFIKLLVFKKPA